MPSLPHPVRIVFPVLGLLVPGGCHPAPGHDRTESLAARPPRLSPQARARSRAVVRDLERATAGLLYVSEADFPVEVLHFPAGHGPPTADRIARATGRAGSPALVETVAEFFRTATTPQPWHSPAEQQDVRRFQTLVQILETQLRDTRVFRFGARDIDAFVVGVTSDGDWAGVATHLVQT